jgi:hypothetical protein
MSICDRIETNTKPPPQASPRVPEVVAILFAYNEEDIIGATLEHLAGQGIGIYFLDNWSTDRTLEIARSFLGRGENGGAGVFAIEMFPLAGPSPRYELERSLARKAEVARELHQRGARWIMHYDADELWESPWPGVGLREGLLRVESEGFNAIDHVILEFVPTEDGFERGMSPADFFQYFRLHDAQGRAQQIRAWVQQESPVDLTTHAGHAVLFEGRRVYPIPFLNRHYSIRSAAQGRRKMQQDRVPRFRPEDLARGWHQHYGAIDADEHSFLVNKNASGLQLWNEIAVKQAFLTEKYAATAGAMKLRAEELLAELTLAQAEVERLRATQKMLRYRVADRINSTLKHVQILHRALKRMLNPPK